MKRWGYCYSFTAAHKGTRQPLGSPCKWRAPSARPGAGQALLGTGWGTGRAEYFPGLIKNVSSPQVQGAKGVRLWPHRVFPRAVWPWSPAGCCGTRGTGTLAITAYRELGWHRCGFRKLRVNWEMLLRLVQKEKCSFSRLAGGRQHSWKNADLVPPATALLLQSFNSQGLPKTSWPKPFPLEVELNQCFAESNPFSHRFSCLLFYPVQIQ